MSGNAGLLFWGALAAVLVAVVFLLLALRENRSLTRNLERRVSERTAELQHSEERHRSLVQKSTDVITIVGRTGVITYESPASERVFGYAPQSVVGRRFVDVVHPDDRDAMDAYLERFMGRDGEAPVVEWRIRHGDGTWRCCESTGTNLLDDPSVAGFVLSTRDASERKELELQLRHEAFHDQLTGAANRALFRDRAEHALKSAARNRKPVAVLYCDLDNLKAVNDTYGHNVGDLLLAAVAERFAACVRAEDTVARLGGDEFALLLVDSGGEGAVRDVAARLLSSLNEPFDLDGAAVRSTASVGVALSWGRHEVDELLRNADLAMYAAKNHGKARYELFESESHTGHRPENG